jgi:hypothetical protein
VRLPADHAPAASRHTHAHDHASAGEGEAQAEGGFIGNRGGEVSGCGLILVEKAKGRGEGCWRAGEGAAAAGRWDDTGW